MKRLLVILFLLILFYKTTAQTGRLPFILQDEKKLQLADFALFIGDKALAQKVIKEQTVSRIDQHFTVDGAQPLELIRTKSWGYSNELSRLV